MIRWARVAAALLLVLVTAGGSVAACGGWRPTPEARMACCAAGQMCPMRKAATTAKRWVSQAAADACCAAAERDQSAPLLAYAPPALVAQVSMLAAPLDLAPVWRSTSEAFESPPPSRGIPRHLLLSVILI